MMLILIVKNTILIYIQMVHLDGQNDLVILDESKHQREGTMVLCICVIIFVAVRENSFETSQI